MTAPELSDVDGNTEGRRGTISVFNGPDPTIMVFDTPEAEIDSVSRWLARRVACTRARDHLLVTGTGPSSEFLDDMRLRS